MGQRKNKGSEVDDMSISGFSPQYSSSRQKPVTSKKDLRRLCIQRDRVQKDVVFPEPEHNHEHLTVLR